MDVLMLTGFNFFASMVPGLEKMALRKLLREALSDENDDKRYGDHTHNSRAALQR
jgi:hypothetical protein